LASQEAESIRLVLVDRNKMFLAGSLVALLYLFSPSKLIVIYTYILRKIYIHVL